MLWRAVLVSWLAIIAGLALVFAYSDVDQLFNLGLALIVLGPLIALGVVIWQRTPEAAFMFLLALLAPVALAGFIFLALMRNAY